jgi:hypothetical protein
MLPLVEFWGEDSFVRLQPSALRSVKIPKATKTFLIRVGLPMNLHAANQALGFGFDVEADSLPTLSQYAEVEGIELPAGMNGDQYRRIGSSFDAEVCLDEGNNGAVVLILIEPKLRPPEVLTLNSSLEQFLGFLWVYRKSDVECCDSVARRPCQVGVGRKSRAV